MKPEQLSISKSVLKGSLPPLLAMAGLAVWAWIRFPADARIPIHWNLAGEIDRYAGKAEGVLLLPLVCLCLVALFAVLPLIEPRRANLQKSAKPYALTSMALLCFMLLLYGAILAIACGMSIRLPQVIQAGAGVLFILIGNYMGKIRSNFMFGIRTSWTLSSELSWNKTHRWAVGSLSCWASWFFCPPSGCRPPMGSSSPWPEPCSSRWSRPSIPTGSGKTIRTPSNPRRDRALRRPGGIARGPMER